MSVFYLQKYWMKGVLKVLYKFVLPSVCMKKQKGIENIKWHWLQFCKHLTHPDKSVQC